jgi:hypothetical protein
VHEVPKRHAAPQAPQLATSLCESTQAPSQLERLAAQKTRHVPCEQEKLDGGDPWDGPASANRMHEWPQVPQLCGSDARSTQAPRHIAAFAPRSHAHDPETQRSPVGHPLPHPPQFESSEPKSTQAPLQLSRPAAQRDEHSDCEQTPFAGHARPQPPQFAGSELVSTQVSPQRTPTAHTPPSGVNAWHTPLEHARPSPQACMHGPQLSGSELVSTQVSPQRTSPPQFLAVPPSVSHTPFTQALLAPQTLPHAPQLDGSADGCTQVPPHEMPSQGNAPRPVELRVVATASSSSYATFFSGATVTAAGRMAATSEGMFT